MHSVAESVEPMTSRDKFLLACGVAAGPFYLVVALTLALLSEGFDFRRHPLSLLAAGPFGWIQTANFAITGLLVIAASIGMRSVLGRTARSATWLLCGYGMAMIAAAVFTADPVDGYPPGTPLGPPTSISVTGLLHFMAGAFAFLCLALSGLGAAWALKRLQLPSLALLSLVSGLTVLIGFFGGIVLPLGIYGIWTAVVVGWIWLSVLSMRLAATPREAR